MSEHDRDRSKRASVLSRDALVQASIWTGFAVSYEIVRGLARDERAVALANARSIIAFEQRLHGFVEPSLQRDVTARLVIDLADWTYWLAQFAVVGLVVAWVYLRQNDAYLRLRNAVIATNTIGLAGYILFPVAPPRLVAGHGFRDTIAALHGQTGIVHLLANPYAAFPSLHAADAIVIGVVVFRIAAHRVVQIIALLWPVWVSFSLVVSANHFWLDILAGGVVAGAGWLIASFSVRRSCDRRAAAQQS